MSEEVTKVGFGYQEDTDDKLKTKSGGVFGLNQGAYLTKFELNTKAGKDGADGNAIDIVVKIQDREYNSRYYEITKVFNKDGDEISDVASAEYVKGYNDLQMHLGANITHILKAFVDEVTIKQRLSVGFDSFSEWAAAIVSMLPQGFEGKPLDVALQYQWTIKGDNTMTFLELPKNMKGGYWIVPTQTGSFTEDRTSGLVYKNEQGMEHPFTRSVNFMESNKAIQQFEGSSDGSAIESPNNTAGKKSIW